jgi:hypothetical protein
MRVHQFIRPLVATVFALVVAAPNAVVAAPNPPTPVDETPFIFSAGCDFPVLIQLSGKGKAITLSGGRTIFTSPGLNASITNEDNPAHQVTLNITGAFHQTVRANGDVETVVTGRNLLFDPEAGFVLARGTFSFVFDAQGNLIQPLSGQGQLTDVCALLS